MTPTTAGRAVTTVDQEVRARLRAPRRTSVSHPADDQVRWVGAPPEDLEIRQLIEAIPHIVWVRDSDGNRVYLNQQGAAFLGVAPERTYGSSWLEFVHPDDVEAARRSWETCLLEGSPHSIEVRVRRRDGEYRWMASRGHPMRDSHGDTVRWVGTLTDIDDRRRAEAELHRAHGEAVATLTLLDTLQANAPVGLAFVDRDFRLLRLNERLAVVNGSAAREQLGRTIAEVVPALWPALEPIYRHVLQTGEAVVNKLVTGPTAEEPDRTHFWLASYYPVKSEGRITGIGVVVVDITEREEAAAAQKALTYAAVAAIAATVDARDPYTAGHQRRVADIASAIAREIRLEPDAIEGIRLAATIHDVGKVAVPAEILSRPSRLSAPEFELVKEHSRAGYNIVAGLEFPWPVADMILQHHERLDGSGYPDGMRGDQINMGARIIAVADVVEAMASHRPYRPALGLNAALEEIECGRGRLFDPDVVDACVRLCRSGRLEPQAGSVPDYPKA